MENKDEEQDVKDVDTSYVEPSIDDNDELVETDENETQPLSSDGENEEEEETVESEEEAVEPSEAVEESPIEGETLREYALRKELENTRKLIRQQKQEELFVKADNVKPEEDFLAQYDPEEVARLEKIVSRLGYVKGSELQAQTFESIANDELMSFMEAHPEYQATNDKDNVLWNTFRNEFNLYKKPENPKDYKKIFERIHSNLKNSTAIDIKKVNASKEKLKVASHSGAAIVGRKQERPKQDISGIRTDMLKGFKEEEIEEFLS